MSVYAIPADPRPEHRGSGSTAGQMIFFRSAVIIPVIDRIQNDHPFRLWMIPLSRPYRPFRTDPIPGPAGQIGRSKQKHEVIIWQYPDFCHIEAENPRLNT